MSTTRKIEVFVAANFESRIEAGGLPSVCNTPAHHHYTRNATPIIGGKALTEEEHEAEFQRRATAMVEAGNEMRRIIASCMNIGIDTMYATQAWDEATIKLP